MLLLAAMPLAYGDAAAGRAAYDKGDYVRAMSEWQSAADHGDAQAQFGLGSLYELGAGDLKQDYNRADYWYQKAAAHDYVQAQYRLVLIWAAGGSDFTADPAEAYKWVTLASESKGVWGSLAADLKTQLDNATNAQQQADGKRRARVWKEMRDASNQAVATIAPSAPVPQVASPAPKSGSSGCPGWPFPTLPCTEQFPALPGASSATPGLVPPQLTKSPLDQLNDSLTQIDCAALRARAFGQ